MEDNLNCFKWKTLTFFIDGRFPQSYYMEDDINLLIKRRRD